MRPAGNATALALLATLVPAAAHAQPAGPAGGRPPGAAPQGGAPMQVPQAAGQLAGRVVGAATGQPIANAGVTVRAAAAGDTALVGGAITRADGSFRIDGLRPGRYTVRVRALGYAPAVRAGVAVTPDAPRADLGRLALATVAARLTEVGVRADRSTETLAPDRNSYTVKDLPSTSGGTAVDVLRNVPAVEVDGDNNVSLRGNSNVVVQINGRVSPMRGAQLGNFLAQLPANMVAKVEVVSNPSAKNDPEGMAGILNIVLKQQADLGTSGGLTVGGGTTGQAQASGNLGHQSGPWTLFGSYGFMHDRRTVWGTSARSTFLADGSGATQLDSDVSGTMLPESHSVTLTAEYKPRERDVIGNNLVFNRRGMSRDNGSRYRTLDVDGVLDGRLNQLTDQSQRDLTLDYALSWKHTVDPQRNALSTELRANHGRGRNDVLLTSESLLADGTASGVPVGLETNLTDERTNALFAQADWTRELRKGTKLETGYKGTFRGQTSDFDVARFADAAGAYQPDLGRSNAFRYREQVNAAYGVLSQRAGKVELQAGLRLEQADTRFDLTTTGRRFDNDYRSLFPSALASYTTAGGRQFKASYSKRISRPDVRQLNPFGFREDALTLFEGNPGLRPEYTHAYELGYQQQLTAAGKSLGTLQLTPFLRHTVDAVRMIGSVDDAGVLHGTFRNAATSDQYGADANVSVRRGRLSGFGGASAYQQVLDAANIAGAQSVRAFGWSARANFTYKITPALDAQGFGMYRAPMRTEQGRISRFALTNVALRQKLRGEKASATLRVMDPFGTMGWGVRATDGRVVQLLDRHFGARGAFLSFNYTFGTQPKMRARPQEPEPAPAGQPGMGPG